MDKETIEVKHPKIVSVYMRRLTSWFLGTKLVLVCWLPVGIAVIYRYVNGIGLSYGQAIAFNVLIAVTLLIQGITLFYTHMFKKMRSISLMEATRGFFNESDEYEKV